MPKRYRDETWEYVGQEGTSKMVVHVEQRYMPGELAETVTITYRAFSELMLHLGMRQVA